MTTDLTPFIQALRGPILVTGASGFIAANLLQRIAAVRPDVFGVVQRERNWRLSNLSDRQIIPADINDPTAVKHLLETVKPQTVFHCAAYGAYSFERDNRLIYQTNFLALTSLVGLLAERALAAFVHAGSSSEYGNNAAGPVEDAACNANSHYAVSKVAAANFLRHMGHDKKFPCVNLRLYSVYGPLEDTSRLIPSLLRRVQEGALPPFVDGRTSRDFVHVDDVCAAFILAAVKMHPGLFGESFNIGSGKKTTISELAELARKLFHVSAEPRFGTMGGREWDMPDWFANPDKARQALGWSAETPLETGLQATARWVASLSDAEFSAGTKQVLAKKRRSVSAIIACYRDGEAIPVMHRRLTETFTRLGIDYEIIFVNDGSPDDSAEVIRRISASDHRVIGISHSRNFGSQMAFRSGMELATKQGVVLLDGDLQDPPELIEDFYRKWEEGWEVVYGRRVARDMPWHWGMLYKGFYRVFAAFSYVRIPLDAGDFSLMDGRVVGWLLRCPERDLFMRGLRAYVGFRQIGVDYVRPERMFGRSTNNLARNLEWAKRGIFSFSNTPITMLTTVGVLLLGISALVAVVEAVLRILYPDIAPRGITTVLVAILFFGSINLFAVGLVGEYVAKIMNEVKGRPRLIRSALIRNGAATDLPPEQGT